MATQVTHFSQQELIQFFQESFDKFKEDLLQEVKSIYGQSADKLMTRMEVSEYLGVSLVTLNRWGKSGALEVKKIGGKVFYHKSEVDSCVEAVNREI